MANSALMKEAQLTPSLTLLISAENSCDQLEND